MQQLHDARVRGNMQQPRLDQHALLGLGLYFLARLDGHLQWSSLLGLHRCQEHLARVALANLPLLRKKKRENEGMNEEE